MKNITLGLLAAAAIGAVSIGSASAMPFSSAAALGESHVQDVRLVCDRFGRCYNTNRGAYRSRSYYAPRHRSRGYHSYGHSRHRGYDRGPRVGIGIGPVGIGVRAW